MKILEKPLDLADVPARLIGNIGGGVTLMLEVDDCPFDLVLPVKQPRLNLVGLRCWLAVGSAEGSCTVPASRSSAENRRSRVTSRLSVCLRDARQLPSARRPESEI